jgi:hypothetical protein
LVEIRLYPLPGNDSADVCDKDVVLQSCMNVLGVVPDPSNETCPVSDGDANEVIGVNVEEDINVQGMDVSVREEDDVKEEDIGVAEDIGIKEEDVTVEFSRVNMEREVTYMYVCQLLDIVAILIELPPALIVV